MRHARGSALRVVQPIAGHDSARQEGNGRLTSSSVWLGSPVLQSLLAVPRPEQAAYGNPYDSGGEAKDNHVHCRDRILRTAVLAARAKLARPTAMPIAFPIG